MSYIYLQEREEVYSADSFSDIPAYVLSRLNLTAEKSCCKDSATECCPNSQSGTTLKHSTEEIGVGKLTLYAEASPAKTLVAQAKVPGLREREADCGASSPALLARYDPATRLWKTRQCSQDAGSGECLEIWPKWGTMRNGQCFLRPTLELRTCASASGFWRTPECSKGGTISREALSRIANGNWKRPSGAVMQLRLQDQVREPRLYPTPNCSGLDGGSNSRKANKKRGIHQMFYSTPTCRTSKRSRRFQSSSPNMGEVEEAELRKMYPTPKCQDSRAALTDRGKCNLGEVVHGGELTPQTREARLNPNWVEWLMGWPIGWTDLRPSATDKYRLWQQQHFNS